VAMSRQFRYADGRFMNRLGNSNSNRLGRDTESLTPPEVAVGHHTIKIRIGGNLSRQPKSS
jgi:hypothetical protein